MTLVLPKDSKAFKKIIKTQIYSTLSNSYLKLYFKIEITKLTLLIEFAKFIKK